VVKRSVSAEVRKGRGLCGDNGGRCGSGSVAAPVPRYSSRPQAPARYDEASVRQEYAAHVCYRCLPALLGSLSGSENFPWTGAATQYNWLKAHPKYRKNERSVHKGVQGVKFLHGPPSRIRTLGYLPRLADFRCPNFDPATGFNWMSEKQKASCSLWLKYARAVEHCLTSLPAGDTCSRKGLEMLAAARAVIEGLAQRGGFP
jgi:hypothetical protein